MPYTSFYAHFPEIAKEETRTLTILRKDDVIPKGSYGLVEMYCDDRNCDCRRVFFEVFDWERGKSLAYIAYGWESAEFYRKWLRMDDPKTIRELQGPILNFGSPQSRFAPAFLELVRDLVLKDTAYVARLKRHYQMFKEKVDPKHFRLPAPVKTPIAPKLSATSTDTDKPEPPARKSRKRHRPRSTDN